MLRKSLYLKKREDKRLRAGHLWVYSNEVDTKKSPLKSFDAGEMVNVLSAEGKNLGSAYVNPHSLIAARVYDERKNIELNQTWFEQRLAYALSLRENLFDQPYYRLCFSEGDYLPGLVIDRFKDCFVLQMNTAGMERVKAALFAALERLFDVSLMVLRNDSPSRVLEGLTQYTEVIKGEVTDVIWMEENNT
ncbi:MAG TPA: RlmI/RlmK family 23S rRNA methyltransferase, partial [Gammaproteobacteria bacterium]|nr:RlmI/RlmK family 23S rRNA methyltransferase [Gammaproteobacteria bacterium]